MAVAEAEAEFETVRVTVLLSRTVVVTIDLASATDDVALATDDDSALDDSALTEEVAALVEEETACFCVEEDDAAPVEDD